MQKIAVIDYGMGNLRSVAKALEHVSQGSAYVKITDDATEIAQADRVVFPGQGAAAACMQALQARDLQHTVAAAFREKPFLGICMGLQVLFDYSEENNRVECLNLLAGRVAAFAATIPASLKIPHIGWNQVWQSCPHPLWQDIEDGTRFYFVHSYYADPDDKRLVCGRAQYGVDFTAALAFENIFAVQFHPEKSGTVGLQLLHNFVNWKGRV